MSIQMFALCMNLLIFVAAFLFFMKIRNSCPINHKDADKMIANIPKLTQSYKTYKKPQRYRLKRGKLYMPEDLSPTNSDEKLNYLNV